MPEIFVDFPAPNWTGAERVLVRTRSGEIEVASNHFAVFGWSELYMSSKWAGRVYCDPEIAQDVDRSARRVFAREFGLELNDKAGIHRSQGFAGARKRDPDSGPPDYFARKPPKPKRGVSRGGLYIRPEDLKLPSLWQTSSAIARDRLARRLRAARQQGYSPIAKGALIRLIDAITSFQAMVYEGGSLQAIQPGEERRLQQIFRDHLRSREFRVQEGLKVAGGEVDLLFEDEVVIEMKIYPRPTDNPTAVGAAFALQARRYALAIDKDIVATFVGYQPRSEMGHRPAADLLDVVRMSDRTVQVRAWVPVGFPLPSRVRARPSPRQRKTN